MVRGLREMTFTLNSRYNRTLNAAIQKLRRIPNISIQIEPLSDSKYRVIMDSDHQAFIRLDAKLRAIVNGPISRRNL